jgi:hypothetical protein
MNLISSGILSSLHHFNPEKDQKLSEYSQFKATAVNREQSADLTIVTKEGDRLTLSADSSFEAAHATYNRNAEVNGTDLESRVRLRALKVEREISITVEGDLNDEEKKEIKKVLREIFKMMKNVLTGHGAKPAVSDLKNIELDTLAAVEAKIEVRKSVLQATHVSAGSATKTSIPIGESARESDPLDTIIGRMADAVRDSKLERDKFLNYFDRNPSRMADEIIRQKPDAWKMRKMVQRIMAELFHQLENI